MRVISFNVFLAPTMRGRFTRKKKINKVIHEWLIEGVDVIGLQELNSFTLGIFGLIYFYFCLYRFLHENLARLVDALLVIEGYIFPLYIYNNTSELEHMIEQHNIINPTKYHIIKSETPNRGVSSGVVTITKHKPETIIKKTLPTDIFNKPGCVCIRVKIPNTNLNYIIFNAHFIPNLPNTTRIYTMINWINNKCYINKNKIRMNSISIAHSIISSMGENNCTNIWMIGDYNICRETESNLYRELINKFDLVDSALVPLCTEHELYGCIPRVKQIDYILSNKQLTKGCEILKYVYPLSDHYAIETEY